MTERGYSVKEVSVRLGITTKSLYDWIKQFAKPESVLLEEADETQENRRLIAELARVTKESDILNKATVCFARDTKLSKHLSKRTGHYYLFDLCSVFRVPCFEI